PPLREITRGLPRMRAKPEKLWSACALAPLWSVIPSLGAIAKSGAKAHALQSFSGFALILERPLVISRYGDAGTASLCVKKRGKLLAITLFGGFMPARLCAG